MAEFTSESAYPVGPWLPALLGPPLPATVESLALLPVGDQDVAEALVLLGLASRSNSVQPMTEVEARELIAAAAPPVVCELRANLAWERQVRDDFHCAWRALDERLQKTPGAAQLLTLCKLHGLPPNKYRDWMAHGYPTRAMLEALGAIERDALCPGIFTRRLRFLLLEQRAFLASLRDEPLIPRKFDQILRERLTTFGSVRAAAEQAAPLCVAAADDGGRIAAIDLIAARIAQLEAGQNPSRTEERLVAALDDVLNAMGALVRSFRQIDKYRDRGNQPPGFLADMDMIARYMMADAAGLRELRLELELELELRRHPDCRWKSRASRRLTTSFLWQQARFLQLPSPRGGLEVAPEYIRPLFLALFPDDYLVPADRRRREQCGKVGLDAITYKSVKFCLSLVCEEHGLYTQTGKAYYIDPVVAGWLPHTCERTGLPLVGEAARWEEQCVRARRSLRHQLSLSEARDRDPGHGRNANFLLEQAEAVPLSVVLSLLDLGWSALPPREHELAWAVHVRNLFIMELLCAKGLRSRTLRGMAKSHFVSRKHGLMAELPAHLNKTGRGLNWLLTPRVVAAYRLYLKAYEILLRRATPAERAAYVDDEILDGHPGSEAIDRLLLTTTGLPMGSVGVLRDAIMEITTLLFGTGINPHAFRYVLASSLLQWGCDPDDVANLMLIHKKIMREIYQKRNRVVESRQGAAAMDGVAQQQNARVGFRFPRPFQARDEGAATK